MLIPFYDVIIYNNYSAEYDDKKWWNLQYRFCDTTNCIVFVVKEKQFFLVIFVWDVIVFLYV